MSVVSVTSGNTVSRFPFTGEDTVRNILLHLSQPLPMPCGGNHTCGKCKVLCSGSLSPMTSEEASFLTPSEIASGIRLACFVRASGDFSVYLPKAEISTLSTTSLPDHGLTGQGWGIAVDIGTTTVAMQLYCLDTGALYGESLQGNRQSRFGADVISRIDFSNQDGSPLLEETIRDQLEEMAASCMYQAGISHLDAAVVTGNTTMLHFWEGLDVSGIAVAPFTPASLFGFSSAVPLRQVFPYLPPCLGPYIGADITCAILASGLMKHPEETSLLIDLGTNGEIVLYHQGKLYCASTAMGPAFEGANLAFGMQALPGAISAVRQTGSGNVCTQVISGCTAAGICGSGILDAVSVMLDRGALDESGLLCESDPDVTVWKGQPSWRIADTEVYVTQKDIRQIQLAKAAVCAGICTLLDTVSLSPAQIDRFYIAGGFGHYMDLHSAARIGLFPPELADRATVIGNAALSGAVLLLLDHTSHVLLQSIQDCAQEIALSGNAVFSDRYIDNIMFETEE